MSGCQFAYVRVGLFESPFSLVKKTQTWDATFIMTTQCLKVEVCMCALAAKCALLAVCASDKLVGHTQCTYKPFHT